MFACLPGRFAPFVPRDQFAAVRSGLVSGTPATKWARSGPRTKEKPRRDTTITTTVTTPQAWRDLADQLTPEQIARLEYYERSDEPAEPRVLKIFAENFIWRDDLAARYSDVPRPADAVDVDDWDATNWDDPEDGEGPVRCFSGTRRVVECNSSDDARVAIDGLQYADGRVERAIRISDAEDLTSGLAREIARALIAAADEMERLGAQR